MTVGKVNELMTKRGTVRKMFASYKCGISRAALSILTKEVNAADRQEMKELKKDELKRVEQIYEGVVKKDPSNPEIMIFIYAAGEGSDVSRRILQKVSQIKVDLLRNIIVQGLKSYDSLMRRVRNSKSVWDWERSTDSIIARNIKQSVHSIIKAMSIKQIEIMAQAEYKKNNTAYNIWRLTCEPEWGNFNGDNICKFLVSEKRSPVIEKILLNQIEKDDHADTAREIFEKLEKINNPH